MSDSGPIVLYVTDSSSCYDVTVAVDRDGGYLPGPGEFAVAAGQAASARGASVMSAHTAEKIISIVTVKAADRPAAVAVALAVVSEALRRPVALPSR
jgi:hypothetical protein